MHLILHLFKKDLRRTHLILAFWLLLVAVQYAIMAASLRPGDRIAQMTYGAIAVIGPVLGMLVLAVLVALLVQEESPAGTTGFWLTRPIARSSVLRAKVMFAAILLAVPLLAEAAVFVAAGVTRHDIALAVPEIVLGELQGLLMVGVLAALTPNFARFAIAGAVAWAGIYLLSFVIGWLPTYLGRDPGEVVRNAATLYHSQRIAHDTLIAAGLGAAFVYQYLTRRTARTVAFAVAVELGAIAINYAWAWDFFPSPPHPAATVQLDLPAIQTTLQSTNVQELPGLRNSALRRKNVSGDILVEGVPAGYAALPKRVHPRLTRPDGRAIAVREPQRSNYMYTAPSRLFEAVLGPVFVYGQPYESTNVGTGLVLLDADAFRQQAQQRLTYSADIDYDVDHFIITARMPVSRGSRVDTGSEHEFITDVLRDGNRINITLHRRYTNLLFARPQTGSMQNSYQFMSAFSLIDRSYALFNAKRQEVVRTQMNSPILLSSPVYQGRLVQETWQISFGPDSYTLTPKLNDAWMANAELIELKLRPAAEFTKTLTAKNFILDEPYRPPVPPPRRPPSNPQWLTRFSLPEHATKAQMSDYVYDIVAASQYWNADAWSELPVEMLAKVGAGNADVILDGLDLFTPYIRGYSLLVPATLRVSGPNDKAAVLRALAANPGLVDLVVKYDWQGDCRATLMAALRAPEKNSLPRGWITAVVKLQDTATYPDLKAYLVRTHNRQMTYNEIRRLPDIDLRETVDAAWKQAKSGTRAEVIDAAAMAIDVGYADALETLVNILRADDVSQPQQITRALALVRRYMPATGNAAALVAWYDANKDNLVFSARQGKFMPAAASSMSGPNDKAAVLRALAGDPALVDLVVRFNWQADCRDTLIAALRDPEKNSLPRGWITAVAKLQDPATYPDLKAYLVRTRYRQSTYNEIRRLPGIDLRETVDASWKRAKSGTPAEVTDAAAMAADVGYPDALETLVNILRAGDFNEPQQITRALTLVRRYTPATGNAAALVAWYDANKDRLTFSAGQRKFMPAAGPN